jgi:hypothetical protein
MCYALIHDLLRYIARGKRCRKRVLRIYRIKHTKISVPETAIGDF